MVRTTLYVEGGGDTREQKTRLRRGFRCFLKRAGLNERMPRIVACGGRDRAYDKFKLAHTDPNRTALLLVDAEEPVTAQSAWQHLKDLHGWDCPSGAGDDQCHLMVQVMESWFLADRDALAVYYGTDFRSNAIPQWPNIERVRKSDLSNKLRLATRRTRKGQYHKGRHSFKILAALDPNKVMNASPYAKRLIDSLDAFGSSS